MDTYYAVTMREVWSAALLLSLLFLSVTVAVVALARLFKIPRRGKDV